MGRTYDVVLYGATGFTGGLTAEYLAAHAGATRWALAGRDGAKLERVRDRLGADVPLVHADSGDPDTLVDLARSSRLVVSTVGPYLKYGEPLVAACADNGTDYADLTGEPEFVDRMYLAYHERAVETGARLVHACGFDSIPHDLGAYYTVKRLPENVPLHVEGFLSAKGSASGGTIASFLGVLRDPLPMWRAASERSRVEPKPSGRRARVARSPLPRTRVHGGVAVPLPTLDPQIIVRSARALDRYGPDFTYGHFLAITRDTSVSVDGGVRAMFKQRPGEGPSAERRAQNWFRMRFTGEGGGVRIATEVAGGDPGYGETAKMLGEAALCLLHDDLPRTSGQVTTAQAMGDALITRLQSAGITFRTL
ncbi:saccharopine dehydrogenase NADP-binding domain-containing protein [Actinocorallia sp. API 0066]|uniref:saccharopine dehydrogenase family protein n=1 Tax=Actinocorallia sp. API 0066 TaxID=2896846 RepID=UPI001E2A82A4|nr:saccharopine dehydrogenase NADP-binding domain-containing protein [Actinocorallia sp. API 0066]MCD0449023.1 saccharopine dehydrogenase NADP-binding domain-containing protein [Actinocorallia sp. API 0066]